MSPERRSLEDREVEFFASYYREERYHPVGWRLRMERELRSLRAVAGGEGLGRVLSVGCGDGRFEILLAAHARHVVAVDLSPEAIDLARRNAQAAGVRNVEFRCMSIGDFEWGERFDAALCIALLHHQPEAELPEFLARIFAHLAPGGFLYCQDPDVHGILRTLGHWVLGERYHRYHSPDERELDPADMAAKLRAAGFETVRTGPIDFTLVPVTYLLRRGPAWAFRLCALFDRIACASPLARWPSGFTLVGRRPAA